MYGANLHVESLYRSTYLKQCQWLMDNDVINLIVRTRGSAIAERSARRSVSVEMLTYCTNNANRSRVSWWALSTTATFYSATCIVLYTHRYSRLNYRTTSTRCSVSHTRNAEVSRTFDKQTSWTTNVVDDNAYSSADVSSWTRTTVADGHEFSAVMRPRRTFLDRSKNAICNYPIFIWRPVRGDSIGVS